MKLRPALMMVALASFLFNISAMALPRLGSNPQNNIADPYKELKHEVYVYQEASMKHANWMYIGFAPRMQDPERIKVIISKRGYTLRVWAQFNEEEIADYPQYLVARFDEIQSIVSNKQLEIPQAHRFKQYAERIEQIRESLLPAQASHEVRFTAGLELLDQHFPQNHRIEQKNNGERVVHLHLVYPITTFRHGMGWPIAKTYRVYNLNERRASHLNGKDYIFSGFPAFWIDWTGKGTGVHGPIRYSEPIEQGYQKGPYGGSYEGMTQFWDENHFLSDPKPRKGLDVRLRWDVVRTNNSEACFRAEPLELRAILPAEDDPKPGDWQDLQPRLMDVPFQVIDTFDKVVMDPDEGEKIVNVDYYVTNPYRFPDKRRWFRTHFLSKSQQRLAREEQNELVEEMLRRTHSFPYLEPHILEFFTPQRTGSKSTMIQLNRAPSAWFYRYCSDWDYRNGTEGCM